MQKQDKYIRENDYGEFKAIEYRIDSKLIIFTGMRDEKEGDSGKHYYVFDDKRFVHLYSQTTGFPKQVYLPDAD